MSWSYLTEFLYSLQIIVRTEDTFLQLLKLQTETRLRNYFFLGTDLVGVITTKYKKSKGRLHLLLVISIITCQVSTLRISLILGCRPMYPESGSIAFLRKTMRVREIVIVVHLSYSHGFAQRRNAFRIHGMAPLFLNTHGVPCDTQCAIISVCDIRTGNVFSKRWP